MEKQKFQNKFFVKRLKSSLTKSLKIFFIVGSILQLWWVWSQSFQSKIYYCF